MTITSEKKLKQGREAAARFRKTEKYIVGLVNKNLEKYGINYEEYSRLLKLQNNKCKICGKDDSDQKRNRRARIHQPLAVDHCHKTKKVRGLLCFKCNVGLGLFQDSSELLIRATSYLMEYSS